MGMYTELVFKADITSAIPDQVHAVLDHLFNGGPRPAALPDHRFFQCSRWGHIGSGSSFYHTPFALSKYKNPIAKEGEKGGYIFSRSDLKNYDNEIDLFLDWVDPYIEEANGFCIGWTWYEEQDEPTLIFKKGTPQ